MPTAIERSIASAFESVENVESVYLRHSGPTFTVFPVINQEDERTLDRIFDCGDFPRRFLQNVNLEFEIIVRHDRDVREFVGENSPVWHRKVEKISAAQR